MFDIVFCYFDPFFHKLLIILDFINKSLISKGTISPDDVKLWKNTDDPEEALSYIADAMVEKFGFNWKMKKQFKKVKA